MSDDLTGPNIYVQLGEIELPPFAHAFVLEAPSMAAIRRRCYLVEREHYDALLRDAERYRWLRAQFWDSARLCVVTNPKKSLLLGSYCPSAEQLDDLIDRSLKGKP